MTNIRELVTKAKMEKLTSDEISYVVKKIEEAKSTPDKELYSLIYILGRGMYGKPIPPEHRKLIEHFLYYPQKPNISGLALDILCHYWWFVDDYVDVLKQFIRGVEWDEGDEVKECAITNAGIYLKKIADKELIAMLLEIFEKSNKNDELEDFNRLLAYCALAESQGVERACLPPYSAHLSDLETKGLLNLAVIKRAYVLLNS